MIPWHALGRGVFAFVSVVGLATDASAAEVRVETDPPAWVEVQEVPQAVPLARERVDVQYLLDDYQLRAGDGQRAVYRRRAERAGSVAGVERVSQLSFDFDPAYEELVLHHVRIHRDGVVHDALQPDQLQVVQQERDLDRRIYDGVNSALAFLHDVRVGDVIDYAWTVEGHNPALDGHLVGGVGLAAAVPVGRLHRRLLTGPDQPASVHLHAGAPPPQVTTVAGWTEHRWTRLRTDAVEIERDRPADHQAVPWAQITAFGSWSEVVRWALPHYTAPEPGPELAALIETFREAGPTDEERMRAALRFVQDEVRYLGIEVGPRALLPHHPDEVLARRFGDCKDKARLLVTVLRALDIEAWPALVSARRRGGIQDLAPSPYAFDHVIVHAIVDGAPVWVDATKTLQRGPVTAMQSDLGVALVLSPERSGLEAIPTPTLEEVEQELVERFVMTELDGPVEVEVTTTYRADAASRVRRRFASRSADEIAEGFRAWYGKALPGLELTAPIELRDDEEADVVQVVERYRAERLWKEGSRRLDGWRVEQQLTLPRSQDRTAPLAVDHPVWVRHVVEVELPVAFELRPDITHIRTDAFSFERSVRYDGSVLTIAHDYRSHADRVEPDALPEHVDAVTKAREATWYRLRRDQVHPGLSDEAKGALLAVTLLLLGVGGPFAVGAARTGARRLSMRRRVAAGEGRTPDHAVRVRDTAGAVELLALIRCDCGGRLDVDRRRGTDRREAGRHVLELRAPCAACASETVRYFRFRD